VSNLLDQVKPICAVCKREVDELIAVRETTTCTTTYIARCHGAEERVELDDQLVWSADHRLSFGLAFDHEALPAAQPAKLTERT
jgi:hypothetical protein